MSADETMRRSGEVCDLRPQYYWTRVRRLGSRYKEFHWPSVEAVLGFAYAYDVLSTHFSKRLAVRGLSLSAFNALMILRSFSVSGCRQQTLSKLLLVSRANVTGLVDSLIRKGLAERAADPRDRRACRVTITARGRRLLEDYLPGHYAEVRRIFTAVGAKEIRLLNHVLERLRQTIKTQ